MISRANYDYISGKIWPASLSLKHVPKAFVHAIEEFFADATSNQTSKKHNGNRLSFVTMLIVSLLDLIFATK